MIHREYQEDAPIVRILPPYCLFGQGRGQAMRILNGMDGRYAPLNDWLNDKLRQHVKPVIPDDYVYALTFDKFEILIALNYTFQTPETERKWGWIPVGAFGYRRESSNRVLREIGESLSTFQEQSPFVKSGIFGETVEQCSQSLDIFKEFIAKVHWF